MSKQPTKHRHKDLSIHQFLQQSRFSGRIAKSKWFQTKRAIPSKQLSIKIRRRVEG